MSTRQGYGRLSCRHADRSGVTLVRVDAAGLGPGVRRVEPVPDVDLGEDLGDGNGDVHDGVDRDEGREDLRPGRPQGRLRAAGRRSGGGR